MHRASSLPVAALTLLVALCLPLDAQEFQRPDGWLTRFDDPHASEADLPSFVSMPPGWHVTTGPAAIFWSPQTTAPEDFRAEMEVFLFDPGERREAFGIILGGRDLQGDARRYTYFLIRNGGQFIIKRRVGDDAPTIRPWTSDDAIRSYADRGGDVSVKNVLTVEARGDQVRFLVNGSEVARLHRGEVDLDGIVGFRVNHGLNVHVSRLEVTPLG